MKTFISYSTANKKQGRTIRLVLADIGIEYFLAHDSLIVSEEWQKRILSELRTCDIFIPLLSKSFKKSIWCDQESGFIINKRGVLIIPISLDGTLPYGFLAKIQAHRMKDKESIKNVLMRAIGKKWPVKIIEILLPSLEKAYSFRNAESVVALFVLYFRFFTKEQANKFAESWLDNRQVWDAALCKIEYLPKFLKLNKNKLKRKLYQQLTSKTD